VLSTGRAFVHRTHGVSVGFLHRLARVDVNAGLSAPSLWAESRDGDLLGRERLNGD
jgi:hypothetical protein